MPLSSHKANGGDRTIINTIFYIIYSWTTLKLMGTSLRCEPGGIPLPPISSCGNMFGILRLRMRAWFGLVSMFSCSFHFSSFSSFLFFLDSYSHANVSQDFHRLCLWRHPTGNLLRTTLWHTYMWCSWVWLLCRTWVWGLCSLTLLWPQECFIFCALYSMSLMANELTILS